MLFFYLIYLNGLIEQWGQIIPAWNQIIFTYIIPYTANNSYALVCQGDSSNENKNYTNRTATEFWYDTNSGSSQKYQFSFFTKGY